MSFCLCHHIRSCENGSLLNKPISVEIQFLDKILIFPCQSQIDHRISREDKFDQNSLNKNVRKRTQINSKFNFNSDSILFMTIFIEDYVYRKVYIHFIDKFEIVISFFFMSKSLSTNGERSFHPNLSILEKQPVTDMTANFDWTIPLYFLDTRPYFLQLMHQRCNGHQMVVTRDFGNIFPASGITV